MRLIDADELIKQRVIIRTRRVFNHETKEIMEIEEAIGERRYVTFEEIENAPTIEAEPITRCKDCILYRETGSVSCCTRSWDPVTRNDFCSYAMRKDGKENDK